MMELVWIVMGWSTAVAAVLIYLLAAGVALKWCGRVSSKEEDHQDADLVRAGGHPDHQAHLRVLQERDALEPRSEETATSPTSAHGAGRNGTRRCPITPGNGSRAS